MVWGLFPVVPLSGEDNYYIFKPGTYKVGRKGCDVIVTKDKGVSRVHAEIVVNTMNMLNPLQNVRRHLSSSVQIRDCSKYGTFVSKNIGSKKKVHELPNKETALQDGDLVSFGTGSATYKFSHAPLILFICSSNQVDRSLEEKISSNGASISHTLNEECTHVLVDQLMPLKSDLVDAVVVAKKSRVLKTWLEFFAEKNISNEIPSCHSHIPTVSVEGVSIRVADPKSLENCLKGYTFVLESVHLLKFRDQLNSLLEVAGAKTISFQEFSSNSQGSEYGDDNRMVCVIPGGAACKPDFNKLLSSLLFNEIDIINAALSGDLDWSILKSPCVLISSSCSTDETIVADSDTEVETATSPYASKALCGGDDVKTEELDDDSCISDKRKNERVEASLDDVSASLHKRKGERMQASIDDVSTSLHEIKRAKEDMPLDASVQSDTHTTSFKDGTGDIKVKKDKVHDYASGNSNAIYSQNLIVRDISRLTNRSSAPNSSVPNFKRFRKISGVQLVALILMLVLFYVASGVEHEDDVIRLVGDAVFDTQKNACVDLTHLVLGYPTQIPCRSAGAIFLTEYIHSLINPKSGMLNSFSAEFSFSVNTSVNPRSFGDGFAFVLTPEPKAGASIGSYALPHKHFALAVDTNAEDTIGVADTGYFRVFTQNVISVGSVKIPKYVRSGEMYRVWLEYSSKLKRVVVFIASLNANKPTLPVLDLPIDMTEVFNRDDNVYVGFVGASRGCNELYKVCSLNLNTKKPKHHDIRIIVIVMVLLTLFAIVTCICILKWKKKSPISNVVGDNNGTSGGNNDGGDPRANNGDGPADNADDVGENDVKDGGENNVGNDGGDGDVAADQRSAGNYGGVAAEQGNDENFDVALVPKKTTKKKKAPSSQIIRRSPRFLAEVTGSPRSS